LHVLKFWKNIDTVSGGLVFARSQPIRECTYNMHVGLDWSFACCHSKGRTLLTSIYGVTAHTSKYELASDFH